MLKTGSFCEHLNKEEWKLLELYITQTKHAKKVLWTDGRSTIQHFDVCTLFSYLHVLNQYYTEVKESCLETQDSFSRESRTSDHSYPKSNTRTWTNVLLYCSWWKGINRLPIWKQVLPLLWIGMILNWLPVCFSSLSLMCWTFTWDFNSYQRWTKAPFKWPCWCIVAELNVLYLVWVFINIYTLCIRVAKTRLCLCCLTMP